MMWTSMQERKKIYEGETSQKKHKYRKIQRNTQKQKLLWLAGFGGAIKNGGKMKLER